MILSYSISFISVSGLLNLSGLCFAHVAQFCSDGGLFVNGRVQLSWAQTDALWQVLAAMPQPRRFMSNGAHILTLLDNNTQFKLHIYKSDSRHDVSPACLRKRRHQYQILPLTSAPHHHHSIWPTVKTWYSDAWIWMDMNGWIYKCNDQVWPSHSDSKRLQNQTSLDTLGNSAKWREVVTMEDQLRVVLGSQRYNLLLSHCSSRLVVAHSVEFLGEIDMSMHYPAFKKYSWYMLILPAIEGTSMKISCFEDQASTTLIRDFDRHLFASMSKNSSDGC